MKIKETTPPPVERTYVIELTRKELEELRDAMGHSSKAYNLFKEIDKAVYGK